MTIDEVLEGDGLLIEVAKSMLAAVVLGRSGDVSPLLWMRLLNTYIDMKMADGDKP